MPKSKPRRLPRTPRTAPKPTPRTILNLPSVPKSPPRSLSRTAPVKPTATAPRPTATAPRPTATVKPIIKRTKRNNNIQRLMNVTGIDRELARNTLQQTKGNLDKAIEFFIPNN